MSGIPGAALPPSPGGQAAVKPPATIGMLGGGQLGRMSAMAAKAMGYRVVVLTPEGDSPCAQVCDGALVAPYDDPGALAALMEEAQVATYEFENVPAKAVAALEGKVAAHPSSHILRICQHRVREKQALRDLGIRTAEFAPVDSFDALVEAAGRLGFPCILKTATGGYDGKGQRVLRGPGDLQDAWAALGGPPPRHPGEPGAGGGPEGETRWILEALVPFEKEVSVIVARNGAGQCATFPVAENVHVDNILHRTVAPARIPPAVAGKARDVGVRIAEGLGLVGVMGVEMFLAGGEVFVNELAPRPHNSGHYTLDACTTSQFEQHIRAVCGLPLGPTRQLQAAVMLNILGQHLPPLLTHLEAVLAHPGAKLHLYGKAESRPGRKMGHLTVLADTVEDAIRAAESLWARYISP